jgi:hypothetical protein
MPLSPEMRATLSQLDGLISESVGLRLAELAAAVPSDQVIVEIGSYRGKSTCYLAAGARSGRGAPVVAIDPWDSPGNAGGRFHFDAPATRLAFARQVAVAGLSLHVLPLRAFSRAIAAAWMRPVGLLYVDGSHTEADVRADWQAWEPHLARPAVVAFDDYRTERNPGVAAVVDQLRRTLDARWELAPAPLAIAYLRR